MHQNYFSQNFSKCKEEFGKQKKQNIFDYKEFSQARKMLHAKSIENLPHQVPPVNHSNFPNKVTHRQMILDEG